MVEEFLEDNLIDDNICDRFKQKQSLGWICHFEIQAYLGSGVKKIDSVFFFLEDNLIDDNICDRFKQKQSLGWICHFEIQAYLGSGVKKIDSVFFFLETAYSTSKPTLLIKNWYKKLEVK